MNEETQNRRDPKKYLTALQVAHDAYMEALENAILPTGQKVEDLKKFDAAVREHRTCLIKECRWSADAVRERTHKPTPSFFEFDENAFTADEYRERAIKAENLLKDVLDYLDPVDALRASIYHYFFTQYDVDDVNISRGKWEEYLSREKAMLEQIQKAEEALRELVEKVEKQKAKK